MRVEAKPLFGAVILGAVAFCALLAPAIAPFDPNDQDILNSLAAPFQSAALRTGLLAPHENRAVCEVEGPVGCDVRTTDGATVSILNTDWAGDFRRVTFLSLSAART